MCELLSPSRAKQGRGVKMEAYAELGVSHVWIIDVDVRMLEIYRLGANATWTRVGAFADDALCRAEPFDAIELDLGALWRAPSRAALPDT